MVTKILQCGIHNSTHQHKPASNFSFVNVGSRKICKRSVVRPKEEDRVDKGHANQKWCEGCEHDFVVEEEFLGAHVASAYAEKYYGRSIKSTPIAY